MYYIIVLLSVLVLYAHAAQRFHDTLSAKDLNHYFGTQARQEVPEYEFVSPQSLKGSRSRRSPFANKREYGLRAFGEDYHLLLEHNKGLIAPGCMVYHMKGNGGRDIVPCPAGQDNCYYLGSSILHNGSRAAVSTCNGLHGIVSVPSHDLVIQPIKEEHVARIGKYPAKDRPYIAYKMVAKRKRSCGVQGAPDFLEKSPQRMRRSAGKKYMEMLLVADKTMFKLHGSDLKHYMLTVANVAAGRYLDPSLQNEIYMTIVHIKILEDDVPGLEITADADSTLKRFCMWQEKFNPESDSDPQHVDAASLFTGIDIVHLNEPTTTGLATIGGMCRKNIRCSYVEDNGLDIGLTLAHETGHSLGMSHDSESNVCFDNKYIMSTRGANGPTAYQWSSCSADYLNKFLSDGNGDCMNDAPSGTGVAMPQDLPGVIYDGTDQCRFFLGEGASLCVGTTLVDAYGGDECAKLVCFDPNLPGSCTGSQAPRMDGTECGYRKWCIKGACADIGPNGPQPQNGGWSKWDQDWTACSRTCGGGVRTKKRKCNNPKPLFGGTDCTGFDTKAELCNLQVCTVPQSRYLEEQCAATDNIPINQQTFHWVPAQVQGSDQCKLYCRQDGQSTIYMRSLNGSQNFKDGTICEGESGGAFHRCLTGKCRAFGCDGVTDSQRTFDKCGVCNGNSDTCKKLLGTYVKGEEHKYVTFVQIPKGSTSILITNKNRYSVLSISVAGTRVFNVQNGERARSGTFSGSGVTVKYRSNPEKIEITGPLTTNIDAQVYRLYGDGYAGVDPDIYYEYYIPVSTGPSGTHVWRTQDGHCSVTCGQGTMAVTATCVRSDNGVKVEDFHCNIMDKPNTLPKPCHKSACPARWYTGAFTPCTVSCGTGTQTRTVECKQEINGQMQNVNINACSGIAKPPTTQDCGTSPCSGFWKTGAWSACSKTCSKGVKTREVKCMKNEQTNQQVADAECIPTDKPVIKATCVVAVCSPDITGDKCEDVAKCAQYGEFVCEEYAGWAKSNCLSHCSYCSKTGGVQECKDVFDNCPGYTSSICSGQYEQWAHLNCAKFCHFCSASRPVTTSAPGTHTAANDCADVADCVAYAKQTPDVCTKYVEWSAQNCRKFCGVCKR